MRDLWVSDVRNSAAACTSCDYGVSAPPLLVHASDDLADRCRLGMVVEVVGHVTQGVESGGGGANGIQQQTKALIQASSGGLLDGGGMIMWLVGW